jgi:splicing factor 3B subunit 3
MPDERIFKTVHFETFGKSGIRRVVPGEYLAADPKGRAIMIASTEKNKLVYILTRSGQTDHILTIGGAQTADPGILPDWARRWV